MDPHDLNAIAQKVWKPLRFLKWFPAKVGICVQVVKVTRVETGESHHFLFMGVGPGAGLSLSAHMWGEGPTVCCTSDCPTFDDFEGGGRMTIVAAAIGVGATLAYLHFWNDTDCTLYFENHFTGDVGLGASAGIYVGYYMRLD